MARFYKTLTAIILSSTLYLGTFGCERTAIVSPSPIPRPVNYSLCKGSAYCKEGIVTRIRDGDTLDFTNKDYIGGKGARLALVAAPERKEPGGTEATKKLEELCPIGREALIDEDDGQKRGSFDRMVAVVWCGDIRSIYEAIRANEEMIKSGHAKIDLRFCSISEFGKDYWAIALGCPH